MSAQAAVGAALKGSIMLTLFGFGLQASRDDLLYFVRRLRLLAQALIAMFAVMPVLAIVMTGHLHSIALFRSHSSLSQFHRSLCFCPRKSRNRAETP